MTARKTIDNFLALKRIAVVGVSGNPKDFTRMLFRELKTRGYDLLPVHPAADQMEGIPVARSVAALAGVEGALLLTKPSVTSQVVRECHQAGIQNIWMYRATGAGSVSPDAVAYCAENSMPVVEGECPFMFLPNTGFPHNVHRFCRKLFGRYPQ